MISANKHKDDNNNGSKQTTAYSKIIKNNSYDAVITTVNFMYNVCNYVLHMWLGLVWVGAEVPVNLL